MEKSKLPGDVQRIERRLDSLSAVRFDDYPYEQLVFIGEIALQLARLNANLESRKL